MRRPSGFAAAGVALAAISLAGLWWVGLKSGLTAGNVVRLGTSGIAAATIGWSALAARGAVIAASRAAIGVAVYAGTATAAAAVWDHRADPIVRGSDMDSVGVGRSDPFDPIGATGLPVKVEIDWGATFEHVAITGGAMLFGAAAAVLAVRSARRFQAPLMVLALLPVVYETVTLASDGAEAGAALGVLAISWLAWALQRAKSSPAVS